MAPPLVHPGRRLTGRCALAAFLSLLGACASINPTLAPARVLAEGAVAAETGTAYNAHLFDPTLARAREAAGRMDASGAEAEEDREALVRGAIAYGATPPGVGGYVAGRAGLGHDAEGHVALIGRVVRLGARRVFWSNEEWSLALGAQGRLGLAAAGLEGTLPGLMVPSSRLYGGDLSFAIGKTSSKLYDVWLAVRGGYTHGAATMQFARVNDGYGFSALFDRFDVATTLGLRVGFGRLSALAEIEANVGYYWAGSSIGIGQSGASVALLPAAALGYAF